MKMLSDLEWITCAIIASAARRSTSRWPAPGTIERGQLGRDLTTLEWWLVHPDFDPEEAFS